MIKASEVRIGNWINYASGGWIQVRGADMPDWSESSCLPIPLTIEILEACGFEYDKDIYCSSDEQERSVYCSEAGVCIAFENGKFYLWVHIDEDFWYSFRWTEVKHLHQLQNIFFALIGKELTIRTPALS